MTNQQLIIKALHSAGITNPYSIAAIMAVVAKESNFKPQSELSYSGTSNANIRKIFSKTRTLSEDQLTDLKKSPERFFNFVYGGHYGNSATEGYKYRGRGFNQLTFKDNYKAYGKAIGVDLVSNPDLLNNPEIAARVVAAYMAKTFKDSAVIVLKRYGAKNINDFKDAKTAVNAFYNANAGFGKDTSEVTTSGKTKALASVNSLFTSVTKFLNSTGGKITGIATLMVIGGILYFYSK